MTDAHWGAIRLDVTDGEPSSSKRGKLVMATCGRLFPGREREPTETYVSGSLRTRNGNICHASCEQISE